MSAARREFHLRVKHAFVADGREWAFGDDIVCDDAAEAIALIERGFCRFGDQASGIALIHHRAAGGILHVAGVHNRR